MGYTGTVNFNGENLFTELKCDNTFFCMNYPQTYMKGKLCLIDNDSIEETYETVSRGVEDCLFSMKSALSIISSLSSILSICTENIFDGDNFIGVIKIQNQDRFGNSQDINFYYPDRISEVPSVSIHERIFVSDEDINDIKSKRFAYINYISIFSVFEDKGRDYYYSIVDEITNIKTRSDILNIIAKVNEQYLIMHQQYLKSYTEAMVVTEKLSSMKNKISQGKKIYVRYENKTLYIVDGNNTEQIPVEDFFHISNLFKNNGLNACYSQMTITDKKEFKDFIDSFPLNKKRDKNLEEVIYYAYNSLNDEDTFRFHMSGGF